MVLDRTARKWKLEFNTLECKALISRTRRFGEDALLAKPLTFMNASGNSAAMLLEKYDVKTEDLIIVYDDIDLPLGNIRIRRGGGAGFHKGIISIIERLGTDEFSRLRVGILGEKGYGDLAEYVLSDFGEEEAAIVNDAVSKSVEALETIVSSGLEIAMRTYNVRNKQADNHDSISDKNAAQ